MSAIPSHLISTVVSAVVFHSAAICALQAPVAPPPFQKKKVRATFGGDPIHTSQGAHSLWSMRILAPLQQYVLAPPFRRRLPIHSIPLQSRRAVHSTLPRSYLPFLPFLFLELPFASLNNNSLLADGSDSVPIAGQLIPSYQTPSPSPSSSLPLCFAAAAVCARESTSVQPSFEIRLTRSSLFFLSSLITHTHTVTARTQRRNYQFCSAFLFATSRLDKLIINIFLEP